VVSFFPPCRAADGRVHLPRGRPARPIGQRSRRRTLPPPKLWFRDARPRRPGRRHVETYADALVRGPDPSDARFAAGRGLSARPGRPRPPHRRRPAGTTTLAPVDVPGRDAAAALRCRRFARDRRGRNQTWALRG